MSKIKKYINWMIDNKNKKIVNGFGFKIWYDGYVFKCSSSEDDGKIFYAFCMLEDDFKIE